MTKLISIIGRSNSGKTTIITRLIPLFCNSGIKVGTIKNTHHSVEFDQPGKDSFKHKMAGSEQVMLLSGDSFAIYGENEKKLNLKQLVSTYFKGFDLVISEGFKNEMCLKIEVNRSANKKTPLYLNPVYEVQAVISDEEPKLDIKHFYLDEIEDIYNWIKTSLHI